MYCISSIINKSKVAHQSGSVIEREICFFSKRQMKILTDMIPLKKTEHLR